MPFKLTAHRDFFGSTHMPAMCLFSGRAAPLEIRSLKLPAPPHTALQRLLPFLAGRQNLRVACVPKELLRWRLCHLKAYIPALLGVAAAVVVLFRYEHPTNPLLGPLGAFGLAVLGALVTSIYLPSARRHCVKIGFTDRRGGLTLIFPSSREHIFWAYHKAFNEAAAQHPEWAAPPAANPSPVTPSPA